jgi:hypothetical protein
VTAADTAILRDVIAMMSDFRKEVNGCLNSLDTSLGGIDTRLRCIENASIATAARAEMKAEDRADKAKTNIAQVLTMRWRIGILLGALSPVGTIVLKIFKVI